MEKTVLVTGAASGFGRGVAFDLARKGCRVIAACQIWPQVWELRQAAQAAGLEMQVIKLDVLGECHELCVSGLAHAGFGYGHALKRSSNMIAN